MTHTELALKYKDRIYPAMWDDIYTTFMQFDTRDKIAELIKRWSEGFCKEMERQPITMRTWVKVLYTISVLDQLMLHELDVWETLVVEGDWISVRHYKVRGTPDIPVSVVVHLDKNTREFKVDVRY